MVLEESSGGNFISSAGGTKFESKDKSYHLSCPSGKSKNSEEKSSKSGDFPRAESEENSKNETLTGVKVS